ncbi:MAG: hypothetical protein AAF525_22205 [Pseudomonadota bacterium]
MTAQLTDNSVGDRKRGFSRREFLSRAGELTAGAAGGIAAVGGSVREVSLEVAEDLVDSTRAYLQAGLDLAEARLDRLETRERRIVQAGVAFMAVSTGVDLSLLL